MAIVVLGIAVWAIVAMVSGKNKNNNTAKVETTAVQEQQPEKKQETEKKPSSVTTTVTPTQPAPVVQEQEDIPSTGPEEFLPIALTAGTFATYLGSRKFAKEA